MTVLLTLLRLVFRPRQLCRHPDGCPVVVGPDALLCVTHRELEHDDEPGVQS